MAVAARSASSARSGRRTQAERTAATRTALLDSTIDCLIEVGYARTTTTLIAERAGVSRGAQLHHFPSKAALVAEAVDHLARRRVEEARREVEKLPSGGDRVRTTLDLIWEGQVGALFDASVELWVAARTDPELREKLAPVESSLLLVFIDTAAEAFGPELAARDDFEKLVLMALSTAQGLALLRGSAGDSLEIERMWAFARERLANLFDEPSQRRTSR
jgi:AcrR family transcriptional regulator